MKAFIASTVGFILLVAAVLTTSFMTAAHLEKIEHHVEEATALFAAGQREEALALFEKSKRDFESARPFLLVTVRHASVAEAEHALINAENARLCEDDGNFVSSLRHLSHHLHDLVRSMRIPAL